MSKFKIIKDRETLSSHDIAKQMNFNTFISGYTPATNFLLSVRSLLIMGVSAVCVVIIAVILLKPSSKQAAISDPFIMPPISQLNIAPTTLMVSGNNDTIINYPSGTKLYIPANAFAYTNDRSAAGPFRISFREFNDQVDQMLSGIPMLYDSAGVKKQFESAGMFDIMAFENNKPVFIKKGKELIVDQQSKNFDNNFNVYYLDTVQRKWLYDKDNSENNILLIAGVDTLLHKKYQCGYESIVLPEKADPLLDNLVIDFDKEQFPELSLFDSVKFQFTDKKNKYNEVGATKTWDDVKITRQGKKHYLVTFSKGKFKQNFVTVPVLDEKDFEKSFAQYDKVRAIRISKFKNVTDSLNKLRAKYDAEQLQHGLNSNQHLTDLIRKGDFRNAVNDYVDAGTLYAMARQSHGISRMIAIRRFGTFNNDRPIQFFYANAITGVVRNTSSNKAEILPKAHYYNEKSNTELEVEKAYLIKRDFNGTYTLDKKSIAEFPVHEGKGSDILVVVTTKKEMLFIKDKEFKASDFSGSDVAFRMHTISANVKTVEEIKHYLNL